MDIDIVCSQTNYSRSEAAEKLETQSYMDVIREYLGASKKIPESQSANQLIYKEIGKFMSQVSSCGKVDK